MFRKRFVWLLCAVLCAATVFMLQYRYDNKYCFPGTRAEEGILDLRETGDSQELSMLTYGWEFYPQKLLSPGEFDGQQPICLYLGQYGGFEAGNQDGAPHGCATYRLNILLPPQAQEYALELPEIYCTSRVWVNGQLVSSLGEMADPSAHPAIRTGMITFHAANRAELVVQAADTRHYYSGMVYPPAFGTVAAVSDLISFRTLRTCIMAAAALTIGILYLLIGLKIGEERRRMTLFAITSLLFSLYVMYPLFHLFGAGYWSYRLEDMSFYLFLTAAVCLHCHLCGIKRGPRRAVLFGCAAVTLLSLAVPSLMLGHSLNAMMFYSVFLDGCKLLIFGWLITTAFLNRQPHEAVNSLLLAGLCAIATALLAQEIAPIFEPVRFGWQTEISGFAFILLMAAGLWFDTVRAYAQRTAMAENIRLMKRQFNLQEENYRIISDNFEETRRMRHDLRHHLGTILELTKQKQYDDLERYIAGYEESADQTVRPVLCDNHAAGAVLTYYQQLAGEKKVPLMLNISLPPKLKLESWNLGVVLGNLLENAIEASEKLPEEQRNVTAYSRITNGNLILTVKNNWNGNLTSENGRILSTKHESFGIGLSSVRSLVEQNGGQFFVRPGNQEFEVSVVLWRQV